MGRAGPRIVETSTTPPKYRVVLGEGLYSLLETGFLATLAEARAVKRQWATVEGIEAWIRKYREEAEELAYAILRKADAVKQGDRE